jgi:predicted alpha/beta-fold hydrolase
MIIKPRKKEIEMIAIERNVTIDFNRLWTTSDAFEFDETLIMPFMKDKYTSIEEYYKDISVKQDTFEFVHIPLLVLDCKDDPFIGPTITSSIHESALKNPNIIAVTTNVGGHLACLTGWTGNSWHETLVLSFVKSCIMV